MGQKIFSQHFFASTYCKKFHETWLQRENDLKQCLNINYKLYFNFLAKLCQNHRNLC